MRRSEAVVQKGEEATGMGFTGATKNSPGDEGTESVRRRGGTAELQAYGERDSKRKRQLQLEDGQGLTIEGGSATYCLGGLVETVGSHMPN